MKLEQVSVRSFGLLRNYTVNFESGLNIVEGGNETGKTTLAAFIRFMLYGFEDERDGVLSERERRINWQTGTAEGSMTLATASGRYRIDRRVVRREEGGAVRYAETCEVTDLDAARAVDLGMSPGEALLGVGRALYESTAFLGQLADGRGGDEVRASIENLMFSGDEKINTGAAIERLTAARDSLLSQDGQSGRLKDAEARAAALSARFVGAMRGQKELLRLRGELAEAVRKRDDAKKQLSRTQELKLSYRNHLILSSFEELHTMERQAEDLAEESRTHREQNSYEGFFPDDTYAADLVVKHRLFTESRTAYEAADNAQHELESREAMPHDVQKNMQRTDKYGGEARVLARHAALRSGFLLFLALALGTAALTALLLVIGISRFLSAHTDALFILCLVAAGIFFVGAVVLTILAVNRHETERAYCLDYGARNTSELRARMKLVSDYRVSAAAHVDALRVARERADETRGAYFTARNVLDETLAQWGKALPASGDAEDFLSIFEGSVRDVIRTDRELNERRAALLNTATLLQTTLAACDEDALRATLTERMRATLAETTPEQIDEGIAYYTEQAQFFATSVEQLTNAIQALHAETELPAEVGEQLSATENELAALRRRYTALDMALRALTGADLRLRAELSPRLAHYAKELVDIMTDGKYTAMTVGDDLSMTFPEEGAARSVDVLSGGTREIAYIALRLALVRLLFREVPPVCFDESFAHQDNDRCYAMLKVFSALSERDGMQTFVFTCRGREYTIAQEIGGSCHLIRMI